MNGLIVSNNQQLVFEDLIYVYEIVQRQVAIIDEDVVNLYLDFVSVAKRIPDIEDIVASIDARNEDIINETCFLFGLPEADFDIVMGKYCHEIASSLDTVCQRILEKYNLSHICCGEMFCGENVHPSQNILFSRWHT